MATVGRPKGLPKTGGGSRKGIPNKATQSAREAIANFVDMSAPRMLAWLDQVANGMPEHDIKPNPAKAIELVQSLAEYHIPKLARTEHTGADGGAIEQKWAVDVVHVNAAPTDTGSA